MILLYPLLILILHQLDYGALNDIRTHVRITHFLTELYDLLSKSIQTSEDMINLIASVEDIKEPFLENYLEPARRVLGLYQSKVSNNWVCYPIKLWYYYTNHYYYQVSVVENATSVDHALDAIEKFSKGTEIELNCLNGFKFICRQGYQLALLIKTKDEEAKKFEALLSPDTFERKKQVSIYTLYTISKITYSYNNDCY